MALNGRIESSQGVEEVGAKETAGRQLAERSHIAPGLVGFLLILSQTCTLYMMAAVVLPEQVNDAMVDLANHYEKQRRWFFGFFLATLVISVSKDLVINGQWPNAVNLGFHAFLATVCVSAIIVPRRRYQELVGIVGAAAVTIYIGLLFTRLR